MYFINNFLSVCQLLLTSASNLGAIINIPMVAFTLSGNVNYSYYDFVSDTMLNGSIPNNVIFSSLSSLISGLGGILGINVSNLPFWLGCVLCVGLLAGTFIIVLIITKLIRVVLGIA